MPGWTKWAISLLIGLAVIVVGFRFAGWLLTVFYVMNCFVLIIVVLLQSEKAADAGWRVRWSRQSDRLLARAARDYFRKATTWCAVMFMVCAFALVLRADRAAGTTGSILEKFSKPAAKPSAIIPAPAKPQPPAPAPQSNTAPAPLLPPQPPAATTPKKP